MFTDLSHRALLFALCSFIMAHASPLAIWLKTAQRLFLIFPPPQRLFPKCLTSHRFAAASNATFGREQRYLRPRAARTAAASRQLLLIARRARPSGGGNLSKTQRLPAANARREGRPECPIPPVAKRCYPRPFPLLHHAPSALLFLLFIIYNQRKEK